MMKAFATLAFAASATALSTNKYDLESQFMMWAVKHSRQYESVAEFESRMENWIKTHFEIAAVNNNPNETVTLGHNKFSDWTDEEYKAILNYRPRPQDMTPTVLEASNSPDSINWVELGAVNPVQDQGSCGSCWAFSAIASMEGQHFVQTGELLKLSEQQCVDCDSESYGCSGGWQDNCMWYVFDNGGISLEEDYPYIAMTDDCFADYNGPVQVKTVNTVEAKSEAQLVAAIAQGPVSVTVDADSTQFRNYSSGVVTSDECGTTLDHAITAVGYGTEDGIDYYLVRNSWGSAWGDNGYIKIGRSGEDSWGICGIQEISVWASTN